MRPGWRFSGVRKAVRDSNRVRITRWLMLDPDHPEHLGRTRGTLWEIRVTMKIELEYRSWWVDLN